MCDSSNIKCPICGSEDVQGDYNYDYGTTSYHCNFCDEDFNEGDITFCEQCGKQIVEGENHIIHEDMDFCSKESIIDYELKNEF